MPGDFATTSSGLSTTTSHSTRLIREHIAGDLLPAETDEARNEHLTGLGYLALGPTNFELQDKALLRMEIVDEQVDTVGRTFLGMTIGCARCHDHKFDPIPTADYYALSGIFRSTKSLLPGNVGSPVKNSLIDSDHQAKLKTWSEHEATLKNEIATLERIVRPNHRRSRIRQAIRAEEIAGIVVDDNEATFEGEWTNSVSIMPWVNDGYRHNETKKNGRKVRFDVPIPESGRYRVDFSYSDGSNRCHDVEIQIHHSEGRTEKHVDQRRRPSVDGLFHDLGTYEFVVGESAVVSIDTDECGPGVVIVDAVRLLPVGEMPQQTANKKEMPTPEMSERLANLEDQLRQHQKQKPVAPLAMGVVDEAEPSDWHIHIRGAIRNLGPVVPRGALSVLNHTDGDVRSPFEIADDQSGRLQLANWIASPQNPLTARVFVNRVWQHLIGEGIVRTPDNFGNTGQLPSHPRLLDYLVSSFVEEDDWSVKSLIRRIATSRVYRLSSSASSDSDPENRFFGRGFRRRLEAEPLRDTILAVSGRLETEVNGGLTIEKLTQYDNGYDHDKHRPNLPSVFVPAFRNASLKFFEVFDFANPNLVVGQRTVSTLPSQSLYLLNSPFMLEQSAAAANRFLESSKTVGKSTEERLNRAWLMTLGRRPTSSETATMMAVIANRGDDSQAWAAVFQALFASVDFHYVD